MSKSAACSRAHTCPFPLVAIGCLLQKASRHRDRRLCRPLTCGLSLASMPRCLFHALMPALFGVLHRPGLAQHRDLDMAWVRALPFDAFGDVLGQEDRRRILDL